LPAAAQPHLGLAADSQTFPVPEQSSARGLRRTGDHTRSLHSQEDFAMNTTLRISTLAAVASLALVSSVHAESTVRTVDFSNGPARVGQAAETYAAAASKAVNTRTFDTVAKSGQAEPVAPVGAAAVRQFDFANAGAVVITQDGAKGAPVVTPKVAGSNATRS
jgi:hypothetical protein